MKIDLHFEKVVKYIRENLINDKWDNAVFYIGFGLDNSRGAHLNYSYKNSEFNKVLSIVQYGPILDEIFHDFDTKILKRHFNEVVLRITHSDYTVEYLMDEEKIIKEKASNARFFPNYIYEGLRSQIFNFEKENNLLKPVYTDDGDLDYYEESWDTGLFTFLIHDKKLKYKIELFKNYVQRVLEIPLQETFKNEIFKHHEITHNLLKDTWQPWNKMIVKAPKNYIPVGEEQNYVEYSLVDEDDI